MDELNQLYSYHVFLFPFQWKYTGASYKDANLEEKSDLGYFNLQLQKAASWNKKEFSIDSRLKYNEANYFYDFVRDILYDFARPHDSKELNADFSAHYEYNIVPDTQHYIIELKEKTFKLLIDSIVLRIYNTGIGVLSFHLNNRNPQQGKPEDILQINQYGRRVYPPFFALPDNIIGTNSQFEPSFFDEGLNLAYGKEIANNIKLSFAGGNAYQHYAAKTNFDDGMFLLPGFIETLFGDIPITTAKSTRYDKEISIFLEPVLDDRMFVCSWYGSDQLIKDLNANEKEKGKNKEGVLAYKSSEWLYKYIFVDGEMLTCQNEEGMCRLITEHTNARWLNYGTFFGASRYSFVCLTSSLESLKKFGAAYLLNHNQTMYFKMVELALLQRSCILKFSDEVNELSGLMRSNKKQLAKNVSSLQKQYIRFVNKIYFREVTAQEQGIELYDLIQEKMRLKDQVTDLDNEINELHNYVSLEEQREENKFITRLTTLTAIFLPATLIAGIMGMNTFEINGSCLKSLGWWFWISIISIVASSLIAWVIFIFFRKNDKKSKLSRINRNIRKK